MWKETVSCTAGPNATDRPLACRMLRKTFLMSSSEEVRVMVSERFQGISPVAPQADVAATAKLRQRPQRKRARCVMSPAARESPRDMAPLIRLTGNRLANARPSWFPKGLETADRDGDIVRSGPGQGLPQQSLASLPRAGRCIHKLCHARRRDGARQAIGADHDPIAGAKGQRRDERRQLIGNAQ